MIEDLNTRWVTGRCIQPQQDNTVFVLDEAGGQGVVFQGVVFRNIEGILCNFIAKHDFVFGCVGWVTNRRILAALATKRGVAIVVNKESFLRDKTRPRMTELYAALPGISCGRFTDGLLGRVENAAGESPMFDGVRCVGTVVTHGYQAARMHNKFLVFATHDPECDPWCLSAVWMGSFNLSHNATRSLEGVLVTTTSTLVRAAYNEFQQIALFSEPLDWTSNYVAPEWQL